MTGTVTNTAISLNIANNIVGSEEVKTIDARQLHNELGVKRDFSNWIKSKLEKYDFVDGEDFTTILAKSNGRPKREYTLTLDTGKEIAMVENNEKGKEIRKYLITTEKAYRKKHEEEKLSNMRKIPDTAHEMLKESINLAVTAGLKYHKEMGDIKDKLKILEYAEKRVKYLEAQKNIDFKELASILGIGYLILFRELKHKLVITNNNIPYKKYLVDGLLVVEETDYKRGKKTVRNYKQTLVTPKGVEYFKKLLG